MDLGITYAAPLMVDVDVLTPTGGRYYISQLSPVYCNTFRYMLLCYSCIEYL